MIRLIGILIGSALAVGLLIVALGVPALSPSVPQAPAEPEPVVPIIEPADEPQADVVPEPMPEPAPEPEPEVVAPDVETTAALIDDIFATREPVEENWYAFWSPFRSEIAASGFVAKLQEKTGIDYRVVKVKTGVYEVAFAYTDDADIQSKLERITTATGLDMSGG